MILVDTSVNTYEGRLCRSTEMQIGNTLFTVISVQSDTAKETAFDKVKRLILSNCTVPPEKSNFR